MSTAAPPEVLLVDDEEDFVDLLAYQFRSQGYGISTAGNGGEALKLLQSRNFDVVVTDIRMREGDGFDLLENIKRNHSAETSVILISGADVEPRTAFNLGAEAIYFKPFQFKKLVRHACRLLLPAERRWGLDHRPSALNVKLALNDIHGAAAEGVFELGRGGFHAILPKSRLRTGDQVSVHVCFEGGPIPALEGAATVRWTAHINADGRAQLGFEWDYLDAVSRQYYIDWIRQRQPRAFIPAG